MGLGFVQFGFVAIYLSESFIRGFMTAAGLQILISVLKYIFGLTIPSYAGPGSIVFVSLGAHPCKSGGPQAATELGLLSEEVVSSTLQDVPKQQPVDPWFRENSQGVPTLGGRAKHMT